MSSEMIVDAAQRQFQAAEETLSAWKPEDSELADLRAYAENAILIFLDRPAILRRVLERFQKVASTDQGQDPLRVWAAGSYLFHAALRPAVELEQVISLLGTSGFAPEGADKLKQAIREIESLRDEFHKTCPVETEKEAEAHRQAIARGEYEDADQAFADIAGVDIETWRERAARARGTRP
jgi:hypothetical protein